MPLLSDGRRDHDLPHASRWRQPFNVLQTNLQEIDVRMDVDEAVAAALDCGADTWLLNAGGIQSFYPTDLTFQTRNPLLGARPSGDLFGDAVAAAKRHGIKVMARFDMSKVSARIAKEHPEWLYRTRAGEPQVFSSLYSVCPSAQYYQARIFDVLDEALDRYDIDAVFFNWFNFNERDYGGQLLGPCHCTSCQVGFERFSGGEPLPANMEAATLGLWREYADSTLADLTVRIADHVDARGEDVGVVLRRGAPIVYLEANNHFRAAPVIELWEHATAEAVSGHVSSRPEASVMVNCVAFLDLAYRLSAEQPEHFAQYVLQTLARGGNPSIFYLGAPGRLPMQESISAGREIMRFRARNSDLYRRLRPAATIGLVRPDLAATAPHHPDAVEEFRGAYLSLLEGALPFDVLPAEELGRLGAAGSLDRYALLVLPDVGTLGAAAEVIDSYVRHGGHLLATGSTGLSREGDVELASSPALHAIPPALSGTELRSSYVVSADQSQIAEYRYDGPVLPVFGRYFRFVWKPDSVRDGMRMPQAPFAPPELAYGHVGSADPDHVRARYGDGIVVQVPWTIGRTYREFMKTAVRDRLLELVRSLVTPDITAEVHESVELIVGRSGASTVVHVINHSGVRRRSYGPHVPVGGGRLVLVGRGGEQAHVQALVAGEELGTRTVGQDLVVDLPTLELFEVVTVTSAV